MLKQIVHKTYKRNLSINPKRRPFMPRRSQMEIFIDILRAIAEGRRKPTHIMYRANLSWIRLKKHLDFLIRQGLIEEEQLDGGVIYTITAKGRGVLEYYRKIEYELYQRRTLPTEIYAHYR